MGRKTATSLKENATASCILCVRVRVCLFVCAYVCACFVCATVRVYACDRPSSYQRAVMDKGDEL